MTLNAIYFGLRYEIGPVATPALAVVAGLVANLLVPRK